MPPSTASGRTSQLGLACFPPLFQTFGLFLSKRGVANLPHLLVWGLDKASPAGVADRAPQFLPREQRSDPPGPAAAPPTSGVTCATIPNYNAQKAKRLRACTVPARAGATTRPKRHRAPLPPLAAQERNLVRFLRASGRARVGVRFGTCPTERRGLLFWACGSTGEIVSSRTQRSFRWGLGRFQSWGG